MTTGNDLGNQPDDESQEHQWNGADELMAALGDAIRSKDGKESIAKLIKSFADDVPLRSRRVFRATIWGYGLSAFMVIGIGLLGWLQVLNKETVGTLIGAVVGGLFQRRSG